MLKTAFMFIVVAIATLVALSVVKDGFNTAQAQPAVQVITTKPARPKALWHGSVSNLSAVHDKVEELRLKGYVNIRVSGSKREKSWGDDFYVIGELY